MNEQMRTYQTLLAALHAFFGAIGVLTGLGLLLVPVGFLGLTALGVMSSLSMLLEYPQDIGWILPSVVKQVIFAVIFSVFLLIPSALAAGTGSVGLGTAYGIYARKPWVKFLGLVAALDCLLILGNPLFGVFMFVGLGMAIGTVIVLWNKDGIAELDEGPPGFALLAGTPLGPKGDRPASADAPPAPAAPPLAAAAPPPPPAPAAAPPPPPPADPADAPPPPEPPKA